MRNSTDRMSSSLKSSPMGDPVFSTSLVTSRKSNYLELPIHFFTIVLNGEPFIRHHIKELSKLPFKWHWHIIEGVAELKHDTAWSLQSGGEIPNEMHRQGTSIDGTTEYLDWLANSYPGQITIYRKNKGEFWDGKLEMVRAPLINIHEKCLLWQIDVDELWTSTQIISSRNMFIKSPSKNAAFYYCNFFVGRNLLVTTRDTYGNYSNYEWLRTWRFEDGDMWLKHEPPVLCRKMSDDEWVDVGRLDPFMHAETEENGLVFQHYAYVLEDHISFKESYYGYQGLLERWRELQETKLFPVLLREYFTFINDDALVNTAYSKGITPLADQLINDQNRKTSKHEYIAITPPLTADESEIKRILYIRVDTIGDAVLAFPVLPYIKQHYPDSMLTVLCQHHIAELYDACPHVNCVIPVDFWKAYHHESYRGILLSKIHALAPDLVINGQYSRSLLNEYFSIGSFGKFLVGFQGDLSEISSESLEENSRLYNRLIPSHGLKEFDKNADLLNGLGIAHDEIEPVLWTTPEDEQFAEDFFSKNNLDGEKTLALFPSGRHGGKYYPYYPEALNDLCQREGLTILALGSKSDTEVVDELLKEIKARSIALCGELTLRQLAAILKRCKIAIGADTGTAHIACAVGTRNVVVMWGGHFGRFFPYSPLTSLVCLPLECYGCNWKCPHNNWLCITEISPAVVTKAAEQTLRSSSQKPRIFVPKGWSGENSALFSPDKLSMLGDFNDVEIIAVNLLKYDMIYFLHHKLATDRLDYIKQYCQQLVIVEYKIMDRHLPETITAEETIHLKRPEVSLTKKHIDALVDAKENGYKYVIVFEDDIDFEITFNIHKYFVELFEKIAEFDIIWIGGVDYITQNRDGAIIVEEGDSKTSRCAHAMLINVESSNKWISDLKQLDLPLDHKYNSIVINHKLKSFWVTPYFEQRTDNGKIKSLIRNEFKQLYE